MGRQAKHADVQTQSRTLCTANSPLICTLVCVNLLSSALPQATPKRRYCNRQRFSSSSSAKRKQEKESRADVEVSDRKGSAKTLIGLRGRVGPSRARGVQRRSRDVFGVTTRIARMHASIALAMTMTEGSTGTGWPKRGLPARAWRAPPCACALAFGLRGPCVRLDHVVGIVVV